MFDLERRIYSVDRLRLNPAGVPVRGVMYFLAILAASMIAGGLPLLGGIVGRLPWYMRDIALPGVGATVLSVIRLEGRSFHLAARALLRYWAGPRRLAGLRRCAAAGGRWRPQEIVLLPDGSDHRMRRLRYAGPGAVLVSVEHERRGRAMERDLSGAARPGLRPVLSLRQPADARVLAEGQVISLGPGARLLVKTNAAGR
ncbi:MAG TPA: hypothetical protein VK778_05010 [Solirubrobacteraceae bacterium]|nr:hypothetical protein [Solirubrobacteraceae bacterium]